MLVAGVGGSDQLLAGGGAGGVSPWLHPGSEAGLKFNDASCQLRQAFSTNELALELDRAAAAAPGNVAHVSGGGAPLGLLGRGGGGGGAGDPGQH